MSAGNYSRPAGSNSRAARAHTSSAGTLKKAHALFRRRRFSQVITMLEPQIFLYRENPAFYYLLGVSCLYADDTGGAYSYLKRAQQLDEDNRRILHALAVVHLKRRETDDALRLWLALLDRDQKNRAARRGLDLVRRTVSARGERVAGFETNPTDSPAAARVQIADLADSGKLRPLYPKTGWYVPRWVIALAILAFVAVPAAFVMPPIVKSALQKPVTQREGVQLLEIGPNVDKLTEYGGEFKFVLPPKEIRDTLSKIQRYFNEYRDNLAMRETNRILHSNASEEVKQKALLFQSHLTRPTFVNFTDNFSYQEVTAHPDLYQGCYVRWRGRVSNLVVTSKVITFDFLVGYEDEKVLEGTVPVSLHFAADIQPSFPLEIIARTDFDKAGHLSLEATSIRPLNPTSASTTSTSTSGTSTR